MVFAQKKQFLITSREHVSAREFIAKVSDVRTIEHDAMVIRVAAGNPSRREDVLPQQASSSVGTEVILELRLRSIEPQKE
jgi:hypothetical protein